MILAEGPPWGKGIAIRSSNLFRCRAAAADDEFRLDVVIRDSTNSSGIPCVFAMIKNRLYDCTSGSFVDEVVIYPVACCFHRCKHPKNERFCRTRKNRGWSVNNVRRTESKNGEKLATSTVVGRREVVYFEVQFILLRLHRPFTPTDNSY